MSYNVQFFPRVIDEDLSKLPKNIQKRIIEAIENRLSTAPDRYGLRLRQSLTGLWRLRVGDYRVAYEIVGKNVKIWAVVYRKDAYEKIAKQWKKHA